MIARFIGIWQNKYATLIKTARKEILEEWARNLGEFNERDVDAAIFHIRNNSEWREKLKGFPPAVDDFLDVMVKLRKENNFELPVFKHEIAEYEKYLKKTEYDLTCALSTAENKIAAYKIIRGCREVLAAVECGHLKRVLHCESCGRYACFRLEQGRYFCEKCV